MMISDPPVFPTIVTVGSISKTEGGLTKRELFAAMAMQSILPEMAGLKNSPNIIHEHIANLSVCMADALITELEKSK